MESFSNVRFPLSVKYIQTVREFPGTALWRLASSLAVVWAPLPETSDARRKAIVPAMVIRFMYERSWSEFHALWFKITMHSGRSKEDVRALSRSG
jgi:hypothetical protein